MNTIKYYDNRTVKYVKYNYIQLFLDDSNVVLFNWKGVNINSIKVKDIQTVEREFDFHLKRGFSFFNLIPYQDLESVEEYTNINKTIETKT